MASLNCKSCAIMSSLTFGLVSGLRTIWPTVASDVNKGSESAGMFPKNARTSAGDTVMPSVMVFRIFRTMSCSLMTSSSSALSCSAVLPYISASMASSPPNCCMTMANLLLASKSTSASVTITESTTAFATISLLINKLSKIEQRVGASMPCWAWETASR